MITSLIIFKTGKRLIALNDIESFLDFGIVMVFFTSFIFFLNYFLRLASKLVRNFSF